MQNNPMEIFEFFRKRRSENANPVPPGGNVTTEDQGLCRIRRDTLVVFCMLAAVAVAAAFLGGMLVGSSRQQTVASKDGGKTPRPSRLLAPLDSRGKSRAADPAPAAARITGPVRGSGQPEQHMVIRVASYPDSQVGRNFATKNCAILHERGFPAVYRERGRYIAIEVGSFKDANDPAAMQMLAKLKAFQLSGTLPFKDAFITSVSK